MATISVAYTATTGGTFTASDFNNLWAGATITLSSSEVTTVKINDLAVTAAKLAADAVTTAKILDANVTYAKIQNVSATDKLLGRSTSGAGVVEEITCTAAGRALLDDAAASNQRTTLGLDSMATQAAGAVAITGGSITGITDLAIADGGTGASTAAAAFDALAPTTTRGDIIFRNATTNTRLAKGSSGDVLTMGANDPQWSTPTTAFTTGDVKLTLKTIADTGWIFMNDADIGSAASAATGRANADTESLFTLLWNNTADAQCAVSGGRGANAAADFAANKTIALPKALGRALACYGAGSGLTSRVLALATGAETHALVEAELAAHTHTTLGVSASVQGTSAAGLNNTAANTGSTGSGTAHNNMQPTLFLNIMIKL